MKRSQPTFLSALLALAFLLGLPWAVLGQETAKEEPTGAGHTGLEPAGLELPELADALPDGPTGVEGLVSDPRSPVVAARIYAYELTSSRMLEAQSDEEGRFLFDSLPAGMYRLIAFKPGFLPAVELLLRKRTEDRQFIQMNLETSAEVAAPTDEAYWSVRGKVPADVLRQLQRVYTLDRAAEGLELEQAALFKANLRAFSGVESFGTQHGEAVSTTAELQVEGAIGGVEVGIGGVFQDLGNPGESSSVEGQVRSLMVEIEPADEHQVRLTTTDSRLDGADLAPVDQQHYRLDWSGRTGEKGETRVSATYASESNLHGESAIRPLNLPIATESWDLEGAYSAQLSQRAHLKAGLLYRQRTNADQLDILEYPDESLGLYTIAESRVKPRIVVEYGLFSSVRDGSLSLMPHGGLVVELGGDWKARSSVAQRVEESGSGVLAISPYHTAAYNDKGACRVAGDACYEVALSHGEGDEYFSVSALHQEIAETLRLYFDGDFFNRLESVFLVDGDVLPELQLSLVRRISPKVLAKLESNVASGGGGIFYATDDTSYQNKVRYLVTSLDTRFQSTSTGIFVAFHHLEQEFDPMEETTEAPARVEMQRLQLMLTQDLRALAGLTSNWAVRLNMEVSRGATPYALTADDELYKKLTGGISVSF